MPPVFQYQHSTPWTSCNTKLWLADNPQARCYSCQRKAQRKQYCLVSKSLPQSKSSGQLIRYSVVTHAQHNEADDCNISSDKDPPSSSGSQQQLYPSLMDGVNWYCYTALALLFLTDFTPLGQWLLSSSGPTAAGRLALLQWAVFVVPTMLWVQNKGWNLRQTFKLLPSGARHCLTGLAAGPVLWLAINTAIAIKTGNPHMLSGATLDANSSAAISEGSSSALLLGAGLMDIHQVPVLLLSAAASPAVAEELLFRGFLLTTVQERLGRVDAVAVCAALFALIHLDPSQFFLYCVLGGACGAVTLASGSVMPAMLLHFGFNAAAVAAGLVLHR